jgi:hypothetical protein
MMQRPSGVYPDLSRTCLSPWLLGAAVIVKTDDLRNLLVVSINVIFNDALVRGEEGIDALGLFSALIYFLAIALDVMIDQVNAVPISFSAQPSLQQLQVCSYAMGCTTVGRVIRLTDLCISPISFLVEMVRQSGNLACEEKGNGMCFT